MFDPPENTYEPNAVCIKGSLSISSLFRILIRSVPQATKVTDLGAPF
jgi:hypothetical protein